MTEKDPFELPDSELVRNVTNFSLIVLFLVGGLFCLRFFILAGSRELAEVTSAGFFCLAGMLMCGLALLCLFIENRLSYHERVIAKLKAIEVKEISRLNEHLGNFLSRIDGMNEK